MTGKCTVCGQPATHAVKPTVLGSRRRQSKKTVLRCRLHTNRPVPAEEASNARP